MSSPVLFQALPPLAPDEYKALEESIQEHGIQVPIIKDENGVVIDGHHRQKIASHLDIPCPEIVKRGYTDSEKRTLALSLNIDRRHLNREQKRALIAESLKADPQLSNREHAKRTGADKNTVTAVRDELESTGEIHQFDKTLGADGKERPASKSRPETEPEPADGTPQSKQSKRRPITDQARDAAWNARSAMEKLQKVLADDRFASNREKLDSILQPHLRFFLEVTNQITDSLNEQEK